MFEIEIKTTDKNLASDINNQWAPDIIAMEEMSKAESLIQKLSDTIIISVGISFSVSVAANLFVDWLKKRSTKNSTSITNIKISNTTQNITIDELKIKINNFYNQKNKKNN